ncbi:MAG: formylglycine-generating enzyme family protein [Myxococcales bacterium]|nr:formylglycine-generating enzyme family protein [Myxococcales bacterium]
MSFFFPLFTKRPQHRTRGFLTLLGLLAFAQLSAPTDAQAETTLTKAGPFLPCKTAPKGMLCIPGGVYIQGSNRNAHHPNVRMRAEAPRHRVTLQTFYIDKTEVTNEDYLKCMKDGWCQPPRYWANPRGTMWPRFRTNKRPFVRATWDMAVEYCTYIGKRLLTEAEWEAAARGPKGDTYPWGNQPPRCEYANYRVEPPHTSYPAYRKMRFCPKPSAKDRTPVKIGQDQTWPVASTPPFRGIYDMAGNGYEWVQDFYDQDAYACDPNEPQSCEKIAPKGPCDGKGKVCVVHRDVVWGWKSKREKVQKDGKMVWKTRWYRVKRKLSKKRRFVFRKRILKGGSWWWFADHLRAAWRRPDGPYTGSHRLSIRCGSSITELTRKKPRDIRLKHIRPPRR